MFVLFGTNNPKCNTIAFKGVTRIYISIAPKDNKTKYIKIEDIENTLAEKVYWKVPNNYFTIMEAINKGVSISEVNPSSNISNNFRDFATKVSDEIIEQSVMQYRI